MVNTNNQWSKLEYSISITMSQTEMYVHKNIIIMIQED